MHRSGRLRLRPWLEEQIQSGKYPGVTWLDQTAQIFQIPWRHAARHGWSVDQDATLFRSWAMHTGRYRPGRDQADPKTWKANFRCALNSLPDVYELQEKSQKRGNDAYRVYKMLPRTHTHRSKKGQKSSTGSSQRLTRGNETLAVHSAPALTSARQSLAGKDHTLQEEGQLAKVELMNENTYKTMKTRGQKSSTGSAQRLKRGNETLPVHSAPAPNTWSLTSAKQSSAGKDHALHEEGQLAKVELINENTYKTMKTRETWETRTEEQEQTEAVFKLMDHLSSTELWEHTGEQRGWRAHTHTSHCDCEDILHTLYSDNYSCWTEASDLIGQHYNKELFGWSTPH